MRSIRRSLTGYLLLLMAATLGVVGVLIDQATGRTIDARRQAAVDLHEAHFEEHCREERNRVDADLMRQAQVLGSVMQTEYYGRFQRELAKFNLTTRLLTYGSGQPLTTALYTANSWAITGRLFREYFSHLPIDEGVLKRVDDDERTHDYVQINNPSGRTRWRSNTLDTQTLPFDAKAAETDRTTGMVFDWHHDDATVTPSGEAVRRVVLKVPLVVNFVQPGRDRGRVRPPGLPPFQPGVPPGLPAGGPSPSPPQLGEMIPKIYVSVARPAVALEAAETRFRAERDEQVSGVDAEVRAERGELRLRLLILGVATFAAIGVGGPLLVGAGLRPLRSLSDAVSRVSEKDFLLPHDRRALTGELAPIHDRLTHTLDSLRRAFDREKQAVADISHELRTPIASLLATLDVALRKPRTTDQYHTTLTECRLIGKQLGQLVERIMTLASLDAGNDRTAVVRLDGADVVAGCAAVVRPLAVAHGLGLHIDLDDPLELDTDPDKLREVVMNLLHNAVEYNRPGGRVEVGGRRDGDRVVIEVRDTGIGMPVDVRDKIFERFFRADASRHATGVHAGLGLAIVKEYVGRLGGTIDVTSEPGQGSLFRLSFPAPQEADPAHATAAGGGGAAAVGSRMDAAPLRGVQIP